MDSVRDFYLLYQLPTIQVQKNKYLQTAILGNNLISTRLIFIQNYKRWIQKILQYFILLRMLLSK